jgi:hypothetical protein
MKKQRYQGLLLVSLIVGLAMPITAGAEEKKDTDLLGLNWDLAFGSGTYATPTQSVNVGLNGFVAEMERGIELFTAKGLSFTLAPSFMILSGTNQFTVTVGGAFPYAQAWETKATFLGSMLQAKYRYSFSIGPIEVGLHNGLGFGYFLQRLDWSWHDPANPLYGTAASETADSFMPMAEIGLTLDTAVSEVSRLGLGLTGMLIPFNVGNYTMTTVVKVGLHYQTSF